MNLPKKRPESLEDSIRRDREAQQEKLEATNDNKRLEADNDNETPEELDKDFEKHFLKDFPHYTAHLGDVRGMAAARRLCRLWNYNNLNVIVMMGDGRDKGERDISAEQVLERDEDNKVTFYTSRRAVKRSLEARGHEAKKANLEEHYSGERADVFIMLDPEARVTSKLLRHIEPRGWVWTDIRTANSLRARGSYRFIGAVARDGNLAFGSRENDPTFWKSMEVDSEESFTAAGESGEGIVSHREAADKVAEAKRAGIRGMTDNVYESYSRLIKLAEDQNPDMVARGETLLTLTLMVGKDEKAAEKTLSINTALPTKKGEHDDKIIVMRKGPI